MRTSVIIIAHNEEKYIKQCIESLLKQTRKADEIILIAHNCTDETEAIARTYPITVISFQHPGNGTNSRIEGLRHAWGDIILCIDGDTYAASSWISVMIETLQEKNAVLVGSWVRFSGTIYNRICNSWNRFFCNTTGQRAARWIWGASMAFWAKDKNFIQNVFEKTIEYSRHAGLTRNADDYWLALHMGMRGNLAVTNKTWVMAASSERTSIAVLRRTIENVRNGAKIESFIKMHSE